LCICFYPQQNITLKYGAHSTSDTTLKNQLYDQLMHLIDVILDGRKCYLESVRGTEKFDILLQQYETERHAIIEQFCKCAAVQMFLVRYIELSLVLSGVPVLAVCKCSSFLSIPCGTTVACVPVN
jgi:hypothetical protein